MNLDPDTPPGWERDEYDEEVLSFQRRWDRVLIHVFRFRDEAVWGWSVFDPRTKEVLSGEEETFEGGVDAAEKRAYLLNCAA